MVNLARDLTNTGFYCFRFDYRGHGDSEGNFEDSTVETRISDINRAVEFFLDITDIEQVGLFGLRLGATLAVLAAENQQLVQFLILAYPILVGKLYIDQYLRSNLTTQLATYRKIIKDRNQLINDLMSNQPLNIDGYLLSKSFYQQLESINLIEKNQPLNIKTLLLLNANDNQHEKIKQ